MMNLNQIIINSISLNNNFILSSNISKIKSTIESIKNIKSVHISINDIIQKLKNDIKSIKLNAKSSISTTESISYINEKVVEKVFDDKIKLNNIDNLQNGDEVSFLNKNFFIRNVGGNNVELYNTKEQALNLQSTSGKELLNSKDYKNITLSLSEVERNITHKFITSFNFTDEFKNSIVELNKLAKKLNIRTDIFAPYNNENSINSFETNLNTLESYIKRSLKQIESDNKINKFETTLDFLSKLTNQKPPSILNVLA